MSLIPNQTVTLDSALCFLMARTNAPSTMGAQLDAARAASVDAPAQGSKGKRKARVATRAGHCLVCDTAIAVGDVVSGKVHLRCFGEKFVHEGMFVCADEAPAESAEPDVRVLAIGRCISALAQQNDCNRGRVAQALARLQRTVSKNGSPRTQGELAIQCLRAYAEFRPLPYGGPVSIDPAAQRSETKTEYRALAAVYAWAQGLAPDVYPAAVTSPSPSTSPAPSPTAPGEVTDLAQAFRAGEAKAAREKAAALYGDAYLALADFITAWNRSSVRRVA